MTQSRQAISIQQICPLKKSIILHYTTRTFDSMLSFFRDKIWLHIKTGKNGNVLLFQVYTELIPSGGELRFSLFFFRHSLLANQLDTTPVTSLLSVSVSF